MNLHWAHLLPSSQHGTAPRNKDRRWAPAILRLFTAAMHCCLCYEVSPGLELCCLKLRQQAGLELVSLLNRTKPASCWLEDHEQEMNCFKFQVTLLIYVQCICMLSCFSHVWFFCDTVNCVPLGFSVHEILQARTLEWVTRSSFRESSQPRD